MSQSCRKGSFQPESPQEGEWFVEALIGIVADQDVFENPDMKFERTSERFRQRCSEAADIALTISKIRKESVRIGFSPISLAQYVQGIADALNLSLKPVLKWIGVKDISYTTVETAGEIARFAKKIGFSLRETLAHIRIGFLEQVGYDPNSLLAENRDTSGKQRDQLEICERMIKELEGESGFKEINSLREITSEVRSEFDDNG